MPRSATWARRHWLRRSPRDAELNLPEEGEVSTAMERRILDFGINDTLAIGNGASPSDGPAPRCVPNRWGGPLPPCNPGRARSTRLQAQASAATQCAPSREAQLHEEPFQPSQPSGSRLKVIVHPGCGLASTKRECRSPQRVAGMKTQNSQ